MEKKCQCQICLDDCSSKKSIQCGFCDFTGCKTCVKESILYSVNEPECPKCNHPWSYEFCIENINRTFMEKDYRSRRKDILFDVQKSKIPGTMGMVENEIKYEELTEQTTTLKIVINDLEKQLNEYKTQLNNKQHEKAMLKENGTKKTFKKKCPKEGCAGFLSAGHKCMICSTKVCSHCNEIISNNVGSGIGGGESKHQEHVCNPDAVASYKLIREETKPCPNCATAIFKINGCDQMWCTNCHVAFSWKTGQKVSGRIHNPHFYEWQKNNDDPNREVGEILCGGVVDLRLINRLRIGSNKLIRYYGPEHNMMSYCKNDTGLIMISIFKNAISQHRFIDHLAVIHREITHFQETVLDKYREICNEQDPLLNTRIGFIRGKITEKKFKSQIIRCDNINRKSQLILNVFEMFYVTFLETFNDMCETIHKKVRKIKNPNEENGDKTYWQLNKKRFLKIRVKIMKSIIRMENLLNYSNKELWKISKLYNQNVPFINFPNIVRKKHNDDDFQCYAIDEVSQIEGNPKMVKMKGIMQERYFNNSKWFNVKMGIYKWNNNTNKETYTQLIDLIDLSTEENLKLKSRETSITTQRLISQNGFRV